MSEVWEANPFAYGAIQFRPEGKESRGAVLERDGDYTASSHGSISSFGSVTGDRRMIGAIANDAMAYFGM